MRSERSRHMKLVVGKENMKLVLVKSCREPGENMKRNLR